ncbi:MAG: hypothetical protein ACRCVG_03680 [Methanobacteriaceae archaeon]
MNDPFYGKFYSDLEVEIRKKYPSGNYLEVSLKDENKFGLYFIRGAKYVSNNYRTRLKKKQGVTMAVVVDFKKEKKFLDFLLKNINTIEHDVGEKFHDDDNKVYKKISLDYTANLNDDAERKVALDWLSDKAVLLMGSVLKLHNQFI